MALDQFFEHIQNQFDKKMPFVAYKKPDASVVKAMLQSDAEIHTTDDFTERGFVFAPFDAESEAFLIPNDISTTIEAKFHPSDNFSTQTKTNQSSDNQKEFHIHLVQKAIETIKKKHLKKVVLSRREAVQTHETNPIELFKKLLHSYATAFVYCWYHPKVGLWLGATPETLLSIRGSQLRTMALAATQTFEKSTDVVWKEKEKEEQQLVTDFIVASLEGSVLKEQASVGNIQVSEVETVQAGNLLHLRTTIKANFKSGTLNLKQLLKALHPTPAVCGFPKDKAKAFILEHEGYPREFYAGFMGELNLQETTTRNTNKRNVENNAYAVSKTVSNLYVNLRCMQIKKDRIYIYVGGGITKDSDAISEWEETVHKTQTIKRIL
jgi:isochorismate synthase